MRLRFINFAWCFLVFFPNKSLSHETGETKTQATMIARQESWVSGGNSHKSRPNDEVVSNGPSRKHCCATLPITAIILTATLLSTTSSMAGGLIMYFEGLASLEESVKETSFSEIAVLHASLQKVLEKTEDSIMQTKKFLYNNDIINTNNSADWSRILRCLSHAQVSDRDWLQGLGVAMIPHDHTTNTTFYGSVWGDVLKNGSKELVYGIAAEYQNPVTTYDENGTVAEWPIPTYLVDPSTGAQGELSYEWDGSDIVLDTPKYNTTTGLPILEASPEKKYAWVPPVVKTALASRWWEPLQWMASDGNLYAFTELESIFAPPPAPHPFSAYKEIVVYVGLAYASFLPPFLSYKESREDTTVLMIDRETNLVIASTLGLEMIPNKICNFTIDDLDEKITCAYRVENMSLVIQEAYQFLADTPFGAFHKESLDGEEYFMRKQHSHLQIELIWLRPTSSVEGKVQKALLLLIIFTCIVLVFDLSISTAEIIFIAVPMRRLSNAIRDVSRMQTEEANAFLSAMSHSPLTEVATMRESAQILVDNMIEFKTFLPSSIFHETEEASVSIQRDPPGSASGEACIVFTDIKGSTQLWEGYHDGMKVGLQLHNEVIREAIKQYDGYEVKTIGDAFMIAFDSALDGLKFSLTVQENLTKAAWPESLLECPLCARDASGHWVGIRIRIGVNYGQVTLDHCPDLRRTDYLGPTVNRAARLESTCVGGSVALMDDLYSTLTTEDFASLHATHVQIGKRVLKGIAQPVGVSLLVPEVFPRRVPQVVLMAQDQLKEGTHNPLQGERPGSENSASSMNQSMVSERNQKKKRKQRMENLTRYTDVLTPVGNATIGFVTEDCFDGAPTEVTVQLNSLMSRVVACLDRTDGCLTSVIGSVLCFGWNISKKCKPHIETAFRFAAMITQSSGDVLRLSLSTSTLMNGYVGNGEHRFVTSIGSAMMQGASTISCMEWGVKVIYSSRSQKAMLVSLSERGFVRPVGTRGASNANLVTLYEVNVDLLQRCTNDKLFSLFAAVRDDDSCEGAEAIEKDEAWSSVYAEAFQARDVRALDRLAIKDPIIAGVRDRMKLALLGEAKQISEITMQSLLSTSVAIDSM